MLLIKWNNPGVSKQLRLIEAFPWLNVLMGSSRINQHGWRYNTTMVGKHYVGGVVHGSRLGALKLRPAKGCGRADRHTFWHGPCYPGSGRQEQVPGGSVSWPVREPIHQTKRCSFGMSVV